MHGHRKHQREIRVRMCVDCGVPMHMLCKGSWECDVCGTVMHTRKERKYPIVEGAHAAKGRRNA